MDGQFDIFNISLPNQSGSFILKRENGILSKANSIPESPLNIQLITGANVQISGFDVQDDNGAHYIFGTSSACFLAMSFKAETISRISARIFPFARVPAAWF